VIFVTVGNFNGFPRLVGAVEQLKAQGTIQDEVLLQVASSSQHTSGLCRVIQFLPPEEFQRKLEEAAVVISHSGAGTMIQTLRAGKVPVVMPRRKKYGEHVDDHQIELAEALAKQGRVIVAYEVSDLPAAIAQARGRGLQSPARPPVRMIDLVSRAIEDLLARRA
jgi:UDP-N-acetylglucosamine transferase subunit ALG13